MCSIVTAVPISFSAKAYCKVGQFLDVQKSCIPYIPCRSLLLSTIILNERNQVDSNTKIKLIFYFKIALKVNNFETNGTP